MRGDLIDPYLIFALDDLNVDPFQRSASFRIIYVNNFDQRVLNLINASLIYF